MIGPIAAQLIGRPCGRSLNGLALPKVSRESQMQRRTGGCAATDPFVLTWYSVEAQAPLLSTL